MRILKSFENFTEASSPITLTIGNFDGVHRGHLSLLQKVRHFAKDEGHTVVITFSNHPSEVLRPQHPTCLLCTHAHKLHLLEKNQIDTTIVLPFTQALAKQSAAAFVERIRQSIPFSHLILGHDATLGKDREGNRFVMKELGETWGFDVHYIDEYRYEGVPISSTQIRQLLLEGKIEEASARLGRPYSIYGAPLYDSNTTGTLSFNVKGLCVPPSGTYSIRFGQGDRLFKGTAYLAAPKENLPPLLEVHLLEPPSPVEECEIIF